LETIITIDTNLFFFFNQKIANPLFDFIMPFLTNLDNWILPIVIFWVYLVFRGGKRGRTAALLLIPVIIGCDQISAQVIKPWVGRVRPCYELENVRLLVGCGGRFAFPSSHATNIAGFTTLFLFFYPKKWYWLAGIAVLIGFSRIYVGKHYLLDILGGYILGTLIATVIFFFYCQVKKKIPKIDYVDKPQEKIK